MTGHIPIAPLVQDAIDSLCNEGCKAVSQYIIDLESGKYSAAVRKLSNAEIRIVIKELKEVMAVYNRSDGDN